MDDKGASGGGPIFANTGDFMTEQKATLYGIGVGPGDPELLTLKALRLIEACDYIAFPGENKEENIAYSIVAQVASGLENKLYLPCPIRMTKDKALLAADYQGAVDKITAALDRGADVAFLTIGDPAIYSTYMPVHKLVKEAGYRAKIISGIPSFCAAAAAMDIELCKHQEQLHIIPSNYDLGQALGLPGTRVFMKAASKLPQLKSALMDSDDQVYMIENCGMPNQRIFTTATAMDEAADYLSLVVAKAPGL